MINSWSLPLLLGALIIVIVSTIILTRLNLFLGNRPNFKPLNNTKHIKYLRSYKKLRFRYYLLLASTFASLIVATISSAILFSRPFNPSIAKSSASNRDVMLCLDVSNSMTNYNLEIFRHFIEISDSLKGERIGLTLWNSTAVSAFPLTDDYDFIKDQLSIVFSYNPHVNDNEHLSYLYNGTDTAPGSSLIGNGIASCINNFDYPDKDRSRSIILATDNESQGDQLISISEAADFALSKNIRIYGINPKDPINPTTALEYKNAVIATHGTYYKAADSTAVKDIVSQILNQEASKTDTIPEVIKIDTPLIPSIFLVVSIATFLLLSWRLHL